MARLLLLDVPGGNDFTVLEDAVRLGYEVTFYTSDLAHYRRQGSVTETALALASDIIEIRPFDYHAFERSAAEQHCKKSFDAILCLIDIRVIEASRLAAKLGLKFLNPTTARLMRDKFSVREKLASHSIRQPRFALAKTLDDVRRAIADIDYPVLVKPSDGYGSQNVSVLFSEADMDAFARLFAGAPADYGLGVYANQRFLVEQCISGRLIGCDVFCNGKERVFLGINDKLMFPPPSFAIRGSCFPSNHYDTPAIRDYAFAILDALNFNFGATHIEMMVADDGFYLVEANPRLVSAQIPYQMGYAFERSIYEALINLHLGLPVAEMTSRWCSAIHWITASKAGTLAAVRLPDRADPLIRRVVFFKKPGDSVRPPICNGDRLGYVIAVGKTQADAEELAESYVQEASVELEVNDARASKAAR